MTTMKLPFWLSWSFIFILLLVFSPAAFACGCIGTENVSMAGLIKQATDSADIVFLGVPTSLHGGGKSEEGADDLVVFDVDSVFKGERVAQIAVHSGMGTAWATSCGYSFKVGARYLVFVSVYEGGSLVAPCSFTAPVEKSAVALRYLRNERPEAEDLLTPAESQRNTQGRICGTVKRSDGKPLVDGEIYIWNDSDPTYKKEASFERAEKAGPFLSYFLPPGTYRITAVDRGDGPTRWVGFFSSRTDDPSTMGKVDVVAGRDFCDVNITLHEQKVFTVRGIARGSEGAPLPIEGVEIRAEMAPDEMFPYLDFVAPDSEGKFTITRVPVGAARLSAYVSEYTDPNWKTAVTDVTVNGNVGDVEILLGKKDNRDVDSHSSSP